MFAFEVVSRTMKKSSKTRKKGKKYGGKSEKEGESGILKVHEAKTAVSTSGLMRMSDMEGSSEENEAPSDVSAEGHIDNEFETSTANNGYGLLSDDDGSAQSSTESDDNDADSLYFSQKEQRKVRQDRARRHEARREARRLKAEREAWTVSGQLENEMQYTLKSWKTLQKGTIRVSFHDGFVDYTLPEIQVGVICLFSCFTNLAYIHSHLPLDFLLLRSWRTFQTHS